jgi:hypothetical protein
MLRIARMRVKYGISVLMIFFVTLLIFPQCLLYVPPQRGTFDDNAFHPLWVVWMEEGMDGWVDG